MNFSHRIAKSVREVYHGKSWTAVDLKSTLADITWEETLYKLGEHNSIAVLVFHLHYYVQGVTKYMQGGPLETKDEDAFELPPISCQRDWDVFMKKVYEEAEVFALLVEKLPEDKLRSEFMGESLGDFYRNLQGIIEHIYYHLGQIVLLKKLMREKDRHSNL